MHQTRNEMPKTWPVERKGTKYLAVASHAKNKGIPLVFVLRDMLHLVTTAREARYLVMNKNVKINSKVRTDEKFPIQVYDVVSFEKSGKNYKLLIENKKFALKEVSGKEAERKVVKVIGKKVLGKDKIQVNLDDGQNILTKEKLSVGDSVVVNNNNGKIEKVLALRTGANVEVLSGKHLGQKGKINVIENLERGKIYAIQIGKMEVRLPLRTLLVVE